MSGRRDAWEPTPKAGLFLLLLIGMAIAVGFGPAWLAALLALGVGFILGLP